MTNSDREPNLLSGARLPRPLKQLADADATLTAAVRGNVDLLNGRLVGFFCSESSPGDAILGTYDLALALRGSGVTFIGGFQSPMEKEFLSFVLRGSVSVVVCPARGIGRMRLPPPLRSPLEDGRLLLLSCFPDDVRRPTRHTVAKRNTQVAALAHCLLVPHAEPGGKVEQLCQEALGQHKRVFTLASADSRLGNLGATKLHPDEAARVLAAAPQRDER